MTEVTRKKRLVLYDQDRWIEPNDYKFYLLWFIYLRMSPSYELARRHRAGTLSDADKTRLPADFEAVVALYDDLGDVQRTEFLPWWEETGIRYLGKEGKPLIATPFAVLSHKLPDPLNNVGYELNEYINDVWTPQGRPQTAMFAIPLSLTKTQILSQVDMILDMYEADLKVPVATRAKYMLDSGKKDLNSLFKYQKCLTIKANAPELPLHMIGAIAELSATYSSRILDGVGTTDDKEALKVLASRALDRGVMLAENAARGIFPSYSKHEHAVAPNWEELSDLIDNAMDWGPVSYSSTETPQA